MTTVGITRLREDLAQFVRRAEMLRTSVIIKRNGHEVAAIVSMQDYETLKAANQDKLVVESSELIELNSHQDCKSG